MFECEEEDVSVRFVNEAADSPCHARPLPSTHATDLTLKRDRGCTTPARATGQHRRAAEEAEKSTARTASPFRKNRERFLRPHAPGLGLLKEAVKELPVSCEVERRAESAV
ncbi:hypothetical protein SKAU_G00391520 [Synaphobranchus kaupii]|uniref:Uncharacterized protein n=1 Tax=Synaphobranchus kaupii TaxID=118154 RepID=A0A9Q1EBQ5_SYNKA|nr:hypothetical protein SKAU_G00391520 [Synaphobranchus kaupii]